MNLRAHEVWLAMRVPLQFKFCVCYDFGCYLTYLCSCAQCSYRCPIFWCSRQFGADPHAKTEGIAGIRFPRPSSGTQVTFMHRAPCLMACCQAYWILAGAWLCPQQLFRKSFHGIDSLQVLIFWIFDATLQMDRLEASKERPSPPAACGRRGWGFLFGGTPSLSAFGLPGCGYCRRYKLQLK